jgi:predicted dehydrogenase
MDEPLIVDMAIHHFDQIRGILSLDPVSVAAHSWNPPWSRFKGNACTNALFKMQGGANVIYNGSWVSQGWETTWDGEWRIQGDEGEIIWKDNEVLIAPKDLFKTVFMEGAVERKGVLVPNLIDMPAEERMASVAEFYDAITDDREPETSGADNLKSLAMVLGAKLSAETEKTVDITDECAICNGG